MVLGQSAFGCDEHCGPGDLECHLQLIRRPSSPRRKLSARAVVVHSADFPLAEPTNLKDLMGVDQGQNLVADYIRPNELRSLLTRMAAMAVGHIQFLLRR
jgi:hypothetical protein